MKKLSPYKPDTDLSEIEYGYPAEYDNGFGEGYYESPEQGDEKQLLKSVISILQRHWLLIVVINLLVTALTIVYVAQKPNYYSAEARIQVNGEINPAVGGSSGGNPVFVSNPGADPAYFATQLQILEGSGLMRRVVKTLDLEHNEDFLHPLKTKRLTKWENVKKMFGMYTPPEAEISEDDSKKTENSLTLNNTDLSHLDDEVEKLAPFVDKLRGGLTVNPVFDSRTKALETRLIDVEFNHQDPAIAAKIANAIGDAYVLQNLEQKIQSNASAGDFLDKRVAELQAEIRRGEERLINYARSNKVIPPDGNQNTVVDRLTNLNVQVGQAENDRIAAQSAYQAAMQNQMWTTTAEGKDSQVIGLEARLNELRTRLAQLKTEYQDEWYEVVQTKQQIATVENQLKLIRKRSSDSQLAGLRERLSEVTERERLLKESFENQRGEVIRQNEASINYKFIQQEIDTNKSLLNGLLQRSRETEVLLTGAPNNVLVLDRALVPDSPEGPERTRTVILAFFASLGLGIGLAFLMDWFDDTIRNDENLESSIGLPLLATIPAAPLNFAQRILPFKFLSNGNRIGGRNYDLQIFEKPQFLEHFVQLGAYLLLSAGESTPKTVLITSGQESEGKTLTALNLASSLAKTKGKVLLIDADLRCPRIHAIKGISNKVGLTTLLAIDEVDYEVIDQTIQKDPTCNLDILTAGEHSVNPGNLLSSKAMKALLKKLSTIYSYIIIDSPPVLYFADSAIISTLVDSVIIIAREKVSSKSVVLKTKNLLNKVGAKIFGVVLNGVPIGRTNYDKYTRYQGGDFSPPEVAGQILKLQ